MLMISFLIIFIIVFAKQLLLLATFALCIKFDSYSDMAQYIPIVLLIGYLLFYFLCSKTIAKKLMIEKFFYDLYSFLSWIISGLLISGLLIYGLTTLDFAYIYDFLPTSGGMFSGLEYIMIPIFLGTYIVVLGIIKLIIYIFKISK